MTYVFIAILGGIDITIGVRLLFMDAHIRVLEEWQDKLILARRSDKE